MLFLQDDGKNQAEVRVDYDIIVKSIIEHNQPDQSHQQIDQRGGKAKLDDESSLSDITFQLSVFTIELERSI